MLTFLAIVAIMVLVAMVSVTIHAAYHGCFWSQMSLMGGSVASVFELIGVLIAGVLSGFNE